MIRVAVIIAAALALTGCGHNKAEPNVVFRDRYVAVHTPCDTKVAKRDDRLTDTMELDGVKGSEDRIYPWTQALLADRTKDKAYIRVLEEANAGCAAKPAQIPIDPVP